MKIENQAWSFSLSFCTCENHRKQNLFE
uniref:Uncharacterized protein n=1 Tax=Rhizophora mucronata TaxID=61149 RepID=A0A2P2P296_RHIMU